MTDKMLLEYLMRGVPVAEIAELEGLHRVTIQRKIRELKRKFGELGKDENTGV